MRRARASALALAFYAALFTLTASGRLGSADAGAQLQAATRLATSGSLAAHDPALVGKGWMRGTDGAYYEEHDIGNTALMLPAAWLGQRLSRESPERAVFVPPPISRLLVSLTMAGISAIGCWFMFRLFALSHPTRIAFFLSLLLPATTLFWAYAKVAWDVLGASVCVCALLFYAARITAGERGWRPAIGAAISIALACSFRLSLLPFLPVAFGIVLLAARPRPGAGTWLGCGCVTAAGLLPSCFYNVVRTGAPWRPATATAAQLNANNAITGHVISGMAGLLFGPNRGLFVYSPVCLLVCALPLVWRRLSRDQRILCAGFGVACVGYAVVIASLKNWGGAFAWGPRYLLPIVPVLVYVSACVLLTLTSRWHRRAAAALVAASACLSLPPVFVNWSAALVAFPHALDQSALWPYQQGAVWQELRWALQGRSLPVPAEIAADASRAAAVRFPDLWMVRLTEYSPSGWIGALAVALACGTVCVWCARELMRSVDGAPPQDCQ